MDLQGCLEPHMCKTKFLSQTSSFFLSFLGGLILLLIQALPFLGICQVLTILLNLGVLQNHLEAC